MKWPPERRKGRPGGGQPFSETAALENDDGNDSIKEVELGQLGSAPLQGQVFFYFGEDVETFTLHFQEIGFVVPEQLRATP